MKVFVYLPTKSNVPKVFGSFGCLVQWVDDNTQRVKGCGVGPGHDNTAMYCGNNVIGTISHVEVQS